MEKPVILKSSGQQMVGMLHLPDRRRGRVPAVVFFHGFTGTKIEPHRIFVKMARALCEAGFAVLRFDFRGSGDSAGDFSMMTISGELTDARAALRFLRTRPAVDPARVGVLGLSMGGMVAALVLGEDPRLRAAALWSAVSHPDRMVDARMTPEARRQLKQMGFTDDHGHAVGKACLDDMVKHRPLEAIARTRAPVLLIHGDKDETVPPVASKAYEASLRKAGRTVVRQTIRGADHTYNSLPWETQVLALTLEWFRCHLGPVRRRN
jgi:uncharacterized protein